MEPRKREDEQTSATLDVNTAATEFASGDQPAPDRVLDTDATLTAVVASRDELQAVYEKAEAVRRSTLTPPRWPAPRQRLDTGTASTPGGDPRTARALGIARGLHAFCAAWDTIEEQRLARPYMRSVGAPPRGDCRSSTATRGRPRSAATPAAPVEAPGLTDLKVPAGRLDAAAWRSCHGTPRRGGHAGGGGGRRPRAPALRAGPRLHRRTEHPAAEAWEAAARCGAVVGKSVTKRTTMLVVGDGFTGRDPADFTIGKAAKAVQLRAKGHRIEVLTEADLVDPLAETRISGVRAPVPA